MPELTPYENFKYNALKAYAGDKVVQTTPGRRAFDAAANAAISVGAGMLFRKGIQGFAKSKNVSMKNFSKFIGVKPVMHTQDIVSDAAFGTVVGLFGRDLKNAIVKYNKSEISAKQLKKELNRSPMFVKAAFLGAMARGAGPAAWALARGVKTIGYGLLPMGPGRLGQLGMRVAGRSTPFPYSHRVFGTAVKGGAAFGAYAGGKKLYDTAKPMNADYTAHLRNNLLAGRVRPEELSYKDMVSVRGRGMQ